MSQDRKLEEALSSAFSGLTIATPHHTVLRSGAAYPKPIPPAPLLPPAKKLHTDFSPELSQSTSSQTEQHQSDPTMSDKPQNVILRGEDKNPKYTGSEETGPDLLTHLQRVEDAFTKFQYTNEKEKLAHLYDSIHTGPCRAQSIIKSDAFKKAKTYDEAKANLISHFGSTCKQGALSVLFRLAATYRPKIKANIAVDDCLGVAGGAFTEFETQFRHSPWTTDEKMNLEDVSRLFSYFVFLLNCTETLFKELQKEEPLPKGRTLFNHISPLSGREPPTEPPSSAVRGVRIQRGRPQSRSPTGAQTPRNRSTTPRGRRPYTRGRSRGRGYNTQYCYNCRITGHHTRNCWYGSNTQQSNQYCSYHKTSGHYTKDCRARPRGGTSSGEASRATSPAIT
ncbi:uncharacterized protein LOC127007620 [Eriocheir sinensis]|uniref:uncharacterized protein LOC127007620 n=1 Tax=Eriocheir sinensis TaxID=95602 RepID=UPI0021C9CA9A|nr:uncharacterized protein LOC127007620 [Eriocheir sinensis]